MLRANQANPGTIPQDSRLEAGRYGRLGSLPLPAHSAIRSPQSYRQVQVHAREPARFAFHGQLAVMFLYDAVTDGQA